MQYLARHKASRPNRGERDPQQRVGEINFQISTEIDKGWDKFLGDRLDFELWKYQFDLQPQVSVVEGGNCCFAGLGDRLI